MTDTLTSKERLRTLRKTVEHYARSERGHASSETIAELTEAAAVLQSLENAPETGELQRLRNIENMALRVASGRRNGVVTDRAALDNLDAALEATEAPAQKALEPLSMDQTQEVLGAVSHEMNESMTDEQVKHMVNRFLGWRLPENFQPDAGISFKPEYNVEYNAARGMPPARHQPIGTNLFAADQAEAMIRYMVDGMPNAQSEGEV